jgi:3-deoxy-manno-octulosonate cytidylyltransferase (CMP-KDO synthetase)
MDLDGKPIIQRVYEAVSRCKLIDQVIVATDDERIQRHIRSFGGDVRMTKTTHQSGTDRIAEVTAAMEPETIVINVQGDEPFVSIEQLTATLIPFETEEVRIATLAAVIREESALFSPNTVKVVTDRWENALYFSRHPIPYLRDIPLGRWIDEGVHLRHLGIYAFRNATLQDVTALPVASSEKQEMLEQLRWLHAGYRIHVARCEVYGSGIDTPADLEEARKRLGRLQ